MRLTVRVRELQQLSRLLARLQHVQNVIEVGAVEFSFIVRTSR